MPTALRASDITVRYGGVVAVNKVSLALDAGQILGLIGPNGAGKTTFFNAITGFAPVTQGTITYLEQDITHMPAYERTRMGMGRTFQTERPFAELTVLENVLISAFLHTSDRKSADAIALQAIEKVGLLDRTHQPAADLNLARLRRLELAKALAVQPKIIFLDEIMAGLNPPALKEMIGLVKGLTADGMSVLMVEHIMEAIIELADHVIVLASGNQIAAGSARDVISNERVIEAYLGTD
jgi:branched-chain amino acid transport system ATP-binding protein